MCVPGANTISSAPMMPSATEVINHSVRAVGTWMDMTAMTAPCAKLDHAAKAITLRCADGSRAANSRKTPSVAKTQHHRLVGRVDGDRQGTLVVRLQDDPYHDHHGKNDSQKQ